LFDGFQHIAFKSTKSNWSTLLNLEDCQNIDQVDFLISDCRGFITNLFLNRKVTYNSLEQSSVFWRLFYFLDL
jgi:hypothetical protein